MLAGLKMRQSTLVLHSSGTLRRRLSQSGTTPVLRYSMKYTNSCTSSRLHEFHALGNTLSYVSQPAFVYCPAHGARQPYHDLSIEEKLHDLFINIYAIAVEANARNESHMVRWILLELVYALDQYPQLLDSRKKHILLKIARVFQGLGHHWIYEHTLLKIAGMHKYSALPSQEDPYHLLANSFRASSMSIRPVLVDRWNETVGGNCVDSNLIVPSLLAAVQHRSPYIILALLVNPQVRANIDERDLNGWTALYTAVANGDEPCCMALLLNGADANTRDYHGHTVLEVAVKGGYLNIVETLIKYKANVNPDLTSCSSPPLHAAIESGQFHHKIVDHLLQSGARVDLRRLYDSKHAIDIAADLGYHELAERMILSLNHTFPVRGSFMSQILP